MHSKVRLFPEIAAALLMFSFMICICVAENGFESWSDYKPGWPMFRATRNGHTVFVTERKLARDEIAEMQKMQRKGRPATPPRGMVYLDDDRFMDHLVGYEYVLHEELNGKTNHLWRFAQTFMPGYTGIVATTTYNVLVPDLPLAPVEAFEGGSRFYQGQDVIDVAMSKDGRDFVIVGTSLMNRNHIWAVHVHDDGESIAHPGQVPPRSQLRNLVSLDQTKVWTARPSNRAIRAAMRVKAEAPPAIQITSQSGRILRWEWTGAEWKKQATG